MRSPQHGSPSLRQALRGALAICGLLPLVGCQAEYAGMSLPSMHYLNDDVQYFQPGPHFRWANTQAATQRARMEVMGIPLPEDVDALGAARAAGNAGEANNAILGPNTVPAGPGGDANSMLAPPGADASVPPPAENDVNALQPNPVDIPEDDSVPPPLNNPAGIPESARSFDNSPF